MRRRLLLPRQRRVPDFVPRWHVQRKRGGGLLHQVRRGLLQPCCWVLQLLRVRGVRGGRLQRRRRSVLRLHGNLVPSRNVRERARFLLSVLGGDVQQVRRRGPECFLLRALRRGTDQRRGRTRVRADSPNTSHSHSGSHTYRFSQRNSY